MRLPALLALVLVVAGGAGSIQPSGAASIAPSHTCGSQYTHAALSWGHKCLRAGQFCKGREDDQYHRYRFHCHTGGRLSRSSGSGNSTGEGCQVGYSPCLPRVADLNCADIPASKKPVRVTGDDPYRLDGDGDGVACEP